MHRAAANLLTGGTVYQTSTRTNPDETADKCVDGDENTKCFTNGNPINGYWRYTLQSAASVSTIFLLQDDPPKQKLFITVGYDENPRNNPICASLDWKSGWFSCPANTEGLYIGVYDSHPPAEVGFREIMAFSEPLLT